MAYPNYPAVDYSYSDWALSQGDASFPGTQVDNDFAGLVAAVTNLNNFVRAITRSDGKLKNGLVTDEALSTELIVGIPEPTTWVTAKAYAVGDYVFNGAGLYRCMTAHTSGTFSTDLAASKWSIRLDASSLTIADGSVTQAKINGATAFGFALTALADAAALRAAAEATTVGSALLTAVDAAAARSALGMSVIGSALALAADEATARAAIDVPSNADLTAVSGSLLPTGAVADFLMANAPTGWLRLNGNTIGSASSGATFTGSNVQALFGVLWNLSNTASPILTSGGSGSSRGANAAADWVANKRLTLPNMNGRFRRSLGGNSGNLGEPQAEMVGPHTHPVVNASATGSGSSSKPGSSNNDGAAPATQNNSGTENRPANIAFITCIKL
jgi:hypothetical protein